ncbi:MAG: hypothetical protein ACOYWZ_18000 [Bacillota bacterium]
MLSPYRRMYINRQQTENSSTESAENTDLVELKKLVTDTLELITKNVSEIKQSINQLNEKINNIEERQLILENQVDSQDSVRNSTSQTDISSIKTELELLKKEAYNNKHNPAPDPRSAPSNNRPVMPGSGFASITPEFLKNLNKR